VSRSIVIRKERVDLVRKPEFQATLLRVTDPRSDTPQTLSIAVSGRSTLLDERRPNVK
jgi:hypothetical protein